MPVQTTYSENIAAAQEGQVVNQEPHTIISRVVEISGGIGFGKVAVQGALDSGIRTSHADHTKFRGITVRNPTVDAANPNAYAQNEPASIMTKGVIYVTAGANVAVRDAAYFVPATGVITNVSTDNVAIPNAFFDATASSGALVPLRLN